MADIDARLDRLTERHEALAQSLEIIAGMQRGNEKNIEAVTEKMDALAHSVDRVVNVVSTLADIVRNHENRIEKLES